MSFSPEHDIACDLLLIDENGLDARKISEMLASDRLTVVNVDSNVQAFLAARTHRYDAVLARLSIREASPFRAFDLLQSHRLLDHTPFLYIAGESERPILREAMNRGVDDIVMIPFSESQLRDAISARVVRWRRNMLHSQAVASVPPRKPVDPVKEDPDESKDTRRSIDASVIVRGACQAHERQRATAVPIRVELEKIRVSIPITLMLRVITTVLHAVDIRNDHPACLKVTLKSSTDGKTAILLFQSAVSPIGFTDDIPFGPSIPSQLEVIDRVVCEADGTFSFHRDAKFPAARITFPVADGFGHLPTDDRPARHTSAIITPLVPPETETI